MAANGDMCREQSAASATAVYNGALYGGDLRSECMRGRAVSPVGATSPNGETGAQQQTWQGVGLSIATEALRGRVSPSVRLHCFPFCMHASSMLTLGVAACKSGAT